MNIEVFKTNITASKVEIATTRLENTLDVVFVHFDLQDCDRVLKIVCSTPIDVATVIDTLGRLEIHASVLEDVVIEN